MANSTINSLPKFLIKYIGIHNSEGQQLHSISNSGRVEFFVGNGCLCTKLVVSCLVSKQL